MPEPLDPSRLPATMPPGVVDLLREVSGAELVKYRDGERLVTEGERDRQLFLVVDGSLVIEKGSALPGGPVLQLATLACDADHLTVVGEMAAFGAPERTASVRSVGASLALRFPDGAMDTLLIGHPYFTRLLCEQFTQRLQETNEALRSLQRRFELAPERRMAQPGEILFRAGQPGTHLHQLLMGAVDLEQEGGPSRRVGPQDLPEGLLEPEAFLRGRPHRHTATVADSAFLLVIDEGKKEALIRSHAALVAKLLEGKL